MIHEVKSPIPGVFYRSPSPEADPFVEVGATVEENDPLALVEVMKTFHHVVSPIGGTVVSIDVEDGDMVDPGQVVMTIANGDEDAGQDS